MLSMEKSELIQLIQSEIQKYVQNTIVPIFIENNIDIDTKKYFIDSIEKPIESIQCSPNINVLNESIVSSDTFQSCSSNHSLDTNKSTITVETKCNVEEKILNPIIEKKEQQLHNTSNLSNETIQMSWSKFVKDCANSLLTRFIYDGIEEYEPLWSNCKKKFNVDKFTNKKFIEYLKEQNKSWTICYTKNEINYHYTHNINHNIIVQKQYEPSKQVMNDTEIPIFNVDYDELTKIYIENSKTIRIIRCYKDDIDLSENVKNKSNITIQAIYEKNYHKKIINTKKCFSELIIEWNKNRKYNYVIEIEKNSVIGIERYKYTHLKVENTDTQLLPEHNPKIEEDEHSEISLSLCSNKSSDTTQEEDLNEFDKMISSNKFTSQ